MLRMMGARKYTHGISVITAVKNRVDNFKHSLKSWLQNKDVDQVVVVDWDSDDGLGEYVSGVGDDRVTFVRVENQPFWCLTKAFNLASRFVKYDKIAKIDADVIISEDFFKIFEMNNHIFYAGNHMSTDDENEMKLNGLVFLNTSDYLKVNGYNENIETYGWDDSDFYNRLETIAKLTRRDIVNDNEEHCYAIHQPHEDRLKYHPFAKNAQTELSHTQEIYKNEKLVGYLGPWGTDDKCMDVEIVRDVDSGIYIVSETTSSSKKTSLRWKGTDIKQSSLGKLVICSSKYPGVNLEFTCPVTTYTNRRKSSVETSPQIDYLNYIIENYDDLPKCMVFVNDDLFLPTGHRDSLACTNFYRFVNSCSITDGFLNFVDARHYPNVDEIKKFMRWWDLYVGVEFPESFRGVPMFCVSRELILQKSKSWYASVLSGMLCGDELFVRLFGFCWRHIFKNSVNISTNGDANIDVEFNVFFHKPEQLELVSPKKRIEGNKRFTFINLNKLKLPKNLIIDGLTPEENRAVYSEYLGIMTLKPTSDMVGFFTYSMPIKFDFKFDDLYENTLDEDVIYAIEYGDPFAKTASNIIYAKYVCEIDAMADFRIGLRKTDMSPLPMSGYGDGRVGIWKGSGVVSRKIFLEYRDWLMKVTCYLLKKYGWDFVSDDGATGKDNLHVRHHIDCLLERLTGYYFSQLDNEKKLILL